MGIYEPDGWGMLNLEAGVVCKEGLGHGVGLWKNF
jgi:hypothetical protein